MRSMVLATLVLAASGLAAGSPPATSHAQTTGGVNFTVDVSPSSYTMCVGEVKEFRFTVKRNTAGIGGEQGQIVSQSITPQGQRTEVTNRNVGTITSRAFTPEDYASAVTSILVFKAKRQGTTRIRFMADFDEYWQGNILENYASTRVPRPIHVENSAEVKVIKCKAKVSGLHVWSGEAYSVMGTLDETEIKADEEGTFTGTGTATWLAQAYAEGCTTTDTMAPSQVNMTGRMDESGQLTVQLDFEPVQDAVTLYCEQFGVVTADSSWTAEPLPEALSLAVPAEGGVVTQPHGLVNTTRTETAPGNAVVVILPEADEAGAFRHGQPAAHVGLDAAWQLWRAAHQAWTAVAR